MANKVSLGGKYINLRGWNVLAVPITVDEDSYVWAIDATGLNLGPAAGLTAINCTALEYVKADNIVSLSGFSFIGCTALRRMSALAFPGGNLALTNLTALEELDVTGALSASIDLSGNALMDTFTASDSASLSTLDLTGCASIVSLYLDGCAFAQSSVDAILAALDTAGLSDGEVDISGGTNAIPSAAGLTSKANLEGKGWTVTVNS